MIKKRYILCEFDHSATEAVSDESIQVKKRVPFLSVTGFDYKRTSSDKIGIFESVYHDLHYNVAQDFATNDCFYMFNPEQIVKISLFSVEDRIE